MEKYAEMWKIKSLHWPHNDATPTPPLP